jgi:hypothetical protein
VSRTARRRPGEGSRAPVRPPGESSDGDFRHGDGESPGARADPRGVQRLSTLDTSFLRVETPSAHMHVGWMATLALPDGEGELDPTKLAERIAARLHGRRASVSGWRPRRSVSRCGSIIRVSALTITSASRRDRCGGDGIWSGWRAAFSLSSSTAGSRSGRSSSSPAPGPDALPCSASAPRDGRRDRGGRAHRLTKKAKEVAHHLAVGVRDLDAVACLRSLGPIEHAPGLMKGIVAAGGGPSFRLPKAPPLAVSLPPPLDPRRYLSGALRAATALQVALALFGRELDVPGPDRGGGNRDPEARGDSSPRGSVLTAQPTRLLVLDSLARSHAGTVAVRPQPNKT